MNWVIKKFNALTPHELYAILQLRNEVFVVEQNCVFQDADNIDQHCHHFMGWMNDKLVAYTRLVPPGVVYPQPSIGRVVTSPSARRTGIGKELMERSIGKLKEIFGETSIVIGAQLYLKIFYQSLGFQPFGDIYFEDGIKHIKMILS
ncbi:MAG TPA: GNAT family N-acetyltransferase [Chitinophagaceae bacterium]|nr:GNAT family N-acetyltransferase [Chitinophagaceae bacterium]